MESGAHGPPTAHPHNTHSHACRHAAVSMCVTSCQWPLIESVMTLYLWRTAAFRRTQFVRHYACLCITISIWVPGISCINQTMTILIVTMIQDLMLLFICYSQQWSCCGLPGPVHPAPEPPVSLRPEQVPRACCNGAGTQQLEQALGQRLEAAHRPQKVALGLVARL